MCTHRSALMVALLGPFPVAAALILSFGPLLDSHRTRFARGDQAGIVVMENGATALANERTLDLSD